MLSFILSNQWKMFVYLLSIRDSSNFIQNMGLAAHGLAEQCCPPLLILLSFFYYSESVGFYHWLQETSWTKIHSLHLSQLKNGLWPSSCPSMVSTHLEAGSCTAAGGMWCCPHPQLYMYSVLQGKLWICTFLTFLLTVCPDRFSLEGVLSGVLRRQHRTLH